VQSRRKAAGQSNTRFIGAFLDVMARTLRWRDELPRARRGVAEGSSL
jgi:hypothetical protein